MDCGWFSLLARKFVGEFTKVDQDRHDCVNVVVVCCSYDEPSNSIAITFRSHFGVVYDDRDTICSDICGSIVDIDTETIDASPPSVEWTVIVQLHPVYSVPAAYVERMWDANGGAYSLSMCQGVLDQLRLTNVVGGDRHTATDTSSDRAHNLYTEDHRHYEFGRLTMEMHPISDKPCFSFHLCQLQDIMTMLNSSMPVPTERSVTNGAGELYLLNWFALMGPYFGLRIDPSLYTQLAAVLA